MWRRAIVVSTRERSSEPKVPVAPPLRYGRSKFAPAPGRFKSGAGEGNRTLVVSLEGFCSTIELHPLAKRCGPDAHAAAKRQPARAGLTQAKPLHYLAIRMTHLFAIAANSTAHRWWWRGATFAARWRD